MAMAETVGATFEVSEPVGTTVLQGETHPFEVHPRFDTLTKAGISEGLAM